MPDKTKPKVTVKMELPQATVDMIDRHGLKLEITRVDKKIMIDQGEGMAEGDGCYSNPGGPSC